MYFLLNESTLKGQTFWFYFKKKEYTKRKFEASSFLLGVDPFSEGKQNKFDRIVSLESDAP